MARHAASSRQALAVRACDQNIRITGYPTEKNPELLKRIIGASSNEGDLVLDCFSGSGTTLAVANSLRRRWIGIDNGREAIATTLRRFAHGVSLMGDFVAKRLEGERLKESLPLFVDSGPPKAIESKNHDAITEFSLWAEAGLAPETKPLVREWQSWIADESREVSEVRRNSQPVERERSAATDK